MRKFLSTPAEGPVMNGLHSCRYAIFTYLGHLVTGPLAVALGKVLTGASYN